MKPKRTFSDWLTNRYQLLVRNEENLAEKHTFSFTYAKVIVVATTLFALLLFGSLYLSKSLLAKWFDPRHAQLEANKSLAILANKVDSLTHDLELKDQFINNVGEKAEMDLTLHGKIANIPASEVEVSTSGPCEASAARSSTCQSAVSKTNAVSVTEHKQCVWARIKFCGLSIPMEAGGFSRIMLARSENGR